MISLNTKILLEQNRKAHLELPQNITLKAGEYEVVLVINHKPMKAKARKKLRFASHQFALENPQQTCRREDIYS